MNKRQIIIANLCRRYRRQFYTRALRTTLGIIFGGCIPVYQLRLSICNRYTSPEFPYDDGFISCSISREHTWSRSWNSYDSLQQGEAYVEETHIGIFGGHDALDGR